MFLLRGCFTLSADIRDRNAHVNSGANIIKRMKQVSDNSECHRHHCLLQTWRVRRSLSFGISVPSGGCLFMSSHFVTKSIFFWILSSTLSARNVGADLSHWDQSEYPAKKGISACIGVPLESPVPHFDEQSSIGTTAEQNILRDRIDIFVAAKLPPFWKLLIGFLVKLDQFANRRRCV